MAQNLLNSHSAEEMTENFHTFDVDEKAIPRSGSIDRFLPHY